MKRKTFLSSLSLAALLFSGCGSQGKVAAVVNGQVITEQELDFRMARLNPSYRAALGNDRRRLLEEMVMESVLLQEARRRQLDRDGEVQRLMKEAQRQILLGRLLEILRESQPVQVTEQEIAQAYQENTKSFLEPETFRASHILVANEEGAKKALEKVKGGQPFAKAAEELSMDTTKTRGGDVGVFTKGQLIPEFEAACAVLQPGQLSGVVKTPLGYHVILLTEHKVERQRPLEEVKEQIRSKLAAQRQQRLVESTVQQLRAKAQVRYHLPVGPVQESASPAGASGPAQPAAAPSPPNS